MKKSIIAIVLAVATLVTFIIPASAWTWAVDGQFEVAQHKTAIVDDGAITVDGVQDDAYLGAAKIEAFPDADPYFRGGAYDGLQAAGTADFYAYCAVDTTGLYVFASIEDTTIFASTNTDGNDGDCFQIYLDWCPPEYAHPQPEVMRQKYEFDGKGWDGSTYHNDYGISGLQLTGWLSADYNGVISSSRGFSPHTGLGELGTDPVVYVAKLIEGGWACEWFIPWGTPEQKEAVKNKEQFHCSIGFQSCDDTDLDDSKTPAKEENTHIRFDQRRELGLSYWANYAMLADLIWGEYPEGYWPVIAPAEGEKVDTSDSIVAVVAALAVAGAGVVLFSKKKED